MSEIVLPDGQRIDVSQPTVVEQQTLALLNTIARLLDMLVRLECGAQKRADLKRDILETEAAIKAMQEEREPTADEKVRAIEEAAQAEYDRLEQEQKLEEAVKAGD